VNGPACDCITSHVHIAVWDGSCVGAVEAHARQGFVSGGQRGADLVLAGHDLWAVVCQAVLVGLGSRRVLLDTPPARKQQNVN